MKPKRKLRVWVKIALLLLPEVVIIGLLFFVALKIDKLNPVSVEVIESPIIVEVCNG